MEKNIIVKWKIKESETARIMQLIPELVEKSRAEEGNIFYHIYRSLNDPNELILHEGYANDEAAEKHKNSAHYQETVAAQIVPHLEIREVTIVEQLY